MNIVDSVVLGVVEGVTEFLPISSTAHMIITSNFLNLEQDDAMVAFEVIIQLGATLAIMLIYLDKINLKQISLWKKVIAAFMPLAGIGYLFRHQIKELFTVTTSAWMFIIGGVIFFLVEYLYKSKDKADIVDNVEDVSMKQALIIGFSQVFALIPGTSRSGSTIVGGMLSGLSRKTAADFSFLLAIPTMLAVSGYEFLKNIDTIVATSVAPLASGFIVSFIVAYISVKIFLKLVANYSLNWYGAYRIAFGIFLLVYISINGKL